MKQLNTLSQPAFLESIAELLDERIQLGKGQPPLLYDDTTVWEKRFKQYLTKHVPADEAMKRRNSTSYYALLDQFVKAWQWVDKQYPNGDSLVRLDAFFNLLERELLLVEKVNTRQRLIHDTARGRLIVGARPVLAKIAANDERSPLDVDRLYRRISLLPNQLTEPVREVVDGNQYPTSMHRLNGVGLTIGLAALSGEAVTHFKPVGQLNYIGDNPRIGFLADAVHPHEGYVQELQDCVDWAIEQKIHVLCLPELSVCLEGRKVLQGYLKYRISQGPLEHLSIVVAGSYHVNQFNEAPVWLIGYDGAITELTYRKHEAFETRLPTNGKTPASHQRLVSFAGQKQLLTSETTCYIREHIASDDAILLLNLPVGLVGVLICKDFLSPSYYAAYDAYEPDYLLIISMNNKGGEFVQIWQKGPKRHSLTAGFYVNATQVVSPADDQTEVVFWGLPDDRDDPKLKPADRKSRVYYRRKNRSRNNNHEALPQHGLVRVTMPPSHFAFDTGLFNPV